MYLQNTTKKIFLKIERCQNRVGLVESSDTNMEENSSGKIQLYMLDNVASSPTIARKAI